MSRWDQRTEALLYIAYRNVEYSICLPPKFATGHSRARRDQDKNQGKTRSRSRSRSPVETRLHELEQDNPRRERQLKEVSQQLQNHSDDSSSADSSNGSNSADASPSDPIKSKVGFNFQKPSTSSLSGTKTSSSFQMQKGKPSAIQMKLMTAQKKETPKLMKPVANAFAADDSDDEPEEMPAECRMRMRNIGRDTPTSSGPNSFGKTKHGFCDAKKIFEKKLNSLTDG
ncbi:PEST proteolytic signal-containing nuclear protein-like isoform X2 [Toxorhynchites rutilus septentrionalis]|uniref:PEST proteolytic signal-containing nuclear protein-like isoform X2 n=1 Tax=Toxorhynchites rutilus septentrionalis TaxID=329112 RepID=UPI002478428E|nr:PEST proteolytic signal-containing nuclear protein-like isoform X2 [Toxorhynchites rutilus septentrionalis]